MLEVEQAARRASEAAHARVRLLADTSALLERSLSSDHALQEVAELLVARIADACALDVIDLGGHLRRAGADARMPDGRRRLLELEGDPRVASALHAEQAIFLQDEGERTRAPCSGAASTLVPLVARGRAVGVLSLGWRDAGRRPARDEWSLVEALAQRIALAVEGALQYRERAHVAQTLQASLLPAALPDIPGVALAAEYVAAGGGMDVGGDFYDVFALDDGAWILVIGDVLGKGAEAAAVTALARYTVRAVAGRSPSPASTLAALNDEMLRQRNPDRRFVTAVLARLEPRADGSARLVVASGGHPPPVLLRAGGEPEVVPCPGTLLGVEADARSFDQEIELAAGDTLVLYTDGVTEARRDQPLTPEALAAALRASAPDGAAAVAREVVRLAEVGGAGALRDDLAVLVVALDAIRRARSPSRPRPPRASPPACARAGAAHRAAPSPARGRRRSGARSGSCDGPAPPRARAPGAGRGGSAWAARRRGGRRRDRSAARRRASRTRAGRAAAPWPRHPTDADPA